MGSTLEIKVLFFAKSRELVGKAESYASFPSSATGTQLLEHIVKRFPSLVIIQHNILLALNEVYLDVRDNSTTITLKAGDEVAVIPPISGG